MAYLDFDGLSTYDGLIKAEISGKIDVGSKAGGIPYGNVDSTSTSTKFTATVDGLTELYDGACVMLHNGVVTSAKGFTVNVNGLGAKKCYSNMTNATQETTIFNVAYTMLFVYSTSLDSGNGGWWIYRGYDANTTTIGYQLRTNATVRNVSDTARYYKIYFTSADGTTWVPASVDSTNNATSARPVNQRPIDPFGRIVYTSASTSYAAGANLAATTIWDQYTLVLGYSFNRTGAALTLTPEQPVYVKCAPQTNGSAIMDADEPIVQQLPTTADGKIYICLGIAYSATNIELVPHHPVYWHDGTGIRIWTGAEPPTYTLPEATTSTLGGVKVDGTTITATDGVISAVGGGGGGVSYATQAVRILASAWSNMTATVNASAATVTNDVIVTPAPSSVSAWASAGIYCSAQGDGTLTFACTTAPTEAVTANVMAFDGGETIVPSTHSVTITTTNPKHSGNAPAIACKLYESVSGSYGSGTDAGTWALGTQIGQMGHTDSTTVEIGREMYGIVAVFADDKSTSVSDSGVTCTGGVSNGGAINGRVLLKVDGDGTATIDDVDYDW